MLNDDRVKAFIGELLLLLDVEGTIESTLREHSASRELMEQITSDLQHITIAKQLAKELQRELDPTAEIM